MDARKKYRGSNPAVAAEGLPNDPGAPPGELAGAKVPFPVKFPFVVLQTG